MMVKPCPSTRPRKLASRNRVTTGKPTRHGRPVVATCVLSPENRIPVGDVLAIHWQEVSLWAGAPDDRRRALYTGRNSAEKSAKRRLSPARLHRRVLSGSLPRLYVSARWVVLRGRSRGRESATKRVR